MQREINRKIAHFLLILVPLSYYFLGKWPSLIVFSILTTVIVGLDFARRTDPNLNTLFVRIFGPILRDHELDGTRFCGASWVGLAACLNFFLFKAEIAITSFTILIFSDGLAAIVGKAVPSRSFFEKSRSGSLAFFIVGCVVLLTCGMIFDSKTWFYLFGLFALFCVTILEARPSLLDIDDGFVIPIFFSTIMTFFDLMWNYNY